MYIIFSVYVCNYIYVCVIFRTKAGRFVPSNSCSQRGGGNILYLERCKFEDDTLYREHII
jgi:hypothetical protein